MSLVEDLLDGNSRALARAITRIESRSSGYRDLVSALYPHAGSASVLGVTGSPGAGKSTLVDELVGHYRDRGETVGVVAVDPSSPYSGGAVLGDRVRMGSATGDPGVFVRSMSTRGSLGGLSTATADAATALDAAGFDHVVVETVGAGQSEVDVVRTADTVAVLVQPGSGDDVQMLKAGILEIGDVFVVNKADLSGAERTVAELEEMVELRSDAGGRTRVGHHGAVETGGTDDGDEGWTPPVVQTVATTGDGVAGLADAVADHRAWLGRSGAGAERDRARAAAAVRRLLREDVGEAVETALERRGGVDRVAARVAAGETDPYAVADDLLDPVRACLDEAGDD